MFCLLQAEVRGQFLSLEHPSDTDGWVVGLVQLGSGLQACWG